MARKIIDQAVRRRVVALAQQGVRPALIRRQVEGLNIGNIYAILSLARRDGVAIERFRTAPVDVGDGGQVLRLAVWKAAHAELLQRAAAARHVTPLGLAQRLIDTVLDGGLIDAILDDGVKSDG